MKISLKGLLPLIFLLSAQAQPLPLSPSSQSTPGGQAPSPSALPPLPAQEILTPPVAPKKLKKKHVSSGSSKKSKREGEPKAVSPSQNQAAASSSAAALVGSPPTDPSVVIARATAYFNGLSTLQAQFTQKNPEGREQTGHLYVARPGRLRFMYDAPSPLDITADGTSLAVRDRRMGTQDLYFITQTPLKFLVKVPVDLRQDVRVVEAGQEASGAYVLIEDTQTFGGTSVIRLLFDSQISLLKGWRIRDPQGSETEVRLSQIDRVTPPDPQLFMIKSQR